MLCSPVALYRGTVALYYCPVGCRSVPEHGEGGLTCPLKILVGTPLCIYSGVLFMCGASSFGKRSGCFSGEAWLRDVAVVTPSFRHVCRHGATNEANGEISQKHTTVFRGEAYALGSKTVCVSINQLDVTCSILIQQLNSTQWFGHRATKPPAEKPPPAQGGPPEEPPESTAVDAVSEALYYAIWLRLS